MAELSLENFVDVSGKYGESEVAISFSSNTVTTTIVQGLTIVKSADKDYWVNGPLTYTLVVTNNSGGKLTSASITDTLNTTLIALDEDYGIYIDESKTQSYTYESGTLTITLPDLADTESATIKFQVTKTS